jgi:hypothetical protein
MSEPKDQTSSKQAETNSAEAKLDPAAALALAVTSAEKSSGKNARASLARELPNLLKTELLALTGTRKHAAQAALIAMAIGLGWAGGSHAVSGGRQALQVLPAWAEAASSSIRQNQEDMIRLAGDVQALKGILEFFRESFEQAKIEAAGPNRPFMERLETLERTGQDTTAAIVRAAEVSERIERAGAATEAKLAAITGRLDTIERHASAKPAQDASADPAQTGSVPDAKSAVKDKPVEGWVLREVYGGGALVESRSGRLYEVTPGRNLPTVGRVEAIERRGRIWVVVTAKGIIGPPERWQ